MASHSHSQHGHSAGLVAWRAAVHSGEAQKEYTVSTQAVTNANSLQQDASQAAISERNLFVAFEDAVAAHELVDGRYSIYRIGGGSYTQVP